MKKVRFKEKIDWVVVGSGCIAVIAAILIVAVAIRYFFF